MYVCGLNECLVVVTVISHHCRIIMCSSIATAAMYSVEITVEKDLVTGKTKVLSTNTLLPKDLSQQGVKVYEDEQKGGQ